VRKTSRRDLEAPDSVGSFKVSASVSDTATTSPVLSIPAQSDNLVHTYVT